MPKKLMSRIIVKLHHRIESESLVWQRGVVLRYKRSRAEITDALDSKEIKIRIEGADSIQLLGIVCDAIEQVNDTLKLHQTRRPKVKIPCICDYCKSQPLPRFFELQEIEDMREKGIPAKQCDRSYDNVNVEKLWGEYQSTKPAPGSKNQEGAKIFLSYAQEDVGWAEKIKLGLVPWIDKNEVVIWDKEHILPGESEKIKIKKYVEEADIVFLLVSMSFFRDDVWLEYIKPLFNKEEAFNIVPIIISPSAWEKTEIKNLRAISNNGEAFKESSDENIVKISTEVEKLLTEYSKKTM